MRCLKNKGLFMKYRLKPRPQEKCGVRSRILFVMGSQKQKEKSEDQVARWVEPSDRVGFGGPLFSCGSMARLGSKQVAIVEDRARPV